MPNNDNRDNDNRTNVLELPIVRQWLAMQRDNERQREDQHTKAATLAELRRAADLIGEAEHILERETISNLGRISNLGHTGSDAWRDAYNLKNLLTVLIAEAERGK